MPSLKQLIDQGMAPVNADLNRLAAALSSTSATSDGLPAAAVQAVRAAHDDAVAAYTSLTTANDGHVRLLQGGGQAIRAFLYLSQGLAALEQALSSNDDATIVSLTKKAKGLIDSANDELLAADRALGCPYGCRKAPAMPAPGAQP